MGFNCELLSHRPMSQDLTKEKQSDTIISDEGNYKSTLFEPHVPQAGREPLSAPPQGGKELSFSVNTSLDLLLKVLSVRHSRSLRAPSATL